MKKILLLVLLTFSTLSFGQTLFKDVDVIDEFGDIVGSTKRNISYGTFSNTATNESKLRTHTILQLNILNYDTISLDQYKKMVSIEMRKKNMSESDINESLKWIKENNYKDMTKSLSNMIGTISFDLYEYENNKATFIDKTGLISIKTKDNNKISSKIFIQDNKVIIIGYKEITKGSSGVENMIKYGFYDWNQSKIFNEIINSNDNIQVVISIGNSIYKFTLEK